MRFRPVFLACAALVVCLCQLAFPANQIIVESRSASCGAITINIWVENDVDLHTLTLPLVIRSLSGGAFWDGPVTAIPEMGRLSTSMTGARLFETGLTDFTSPDQVFFHYESASGADCLPAGSGEMMLGMSFGLGVNAEDFVIDTMAYAPLLPVQMLACTDQSPILPLLFLPGVVTILPDSPPLGTQWDSDTIRAWAGAALTNQMSAVDLEGGVVEGGVVMYYQHSGPGTLDQVSGNWSWSSSPADSGQHIVTAEAYKAACGPRYLPVSFVVELLPLRAGDVNCDGVVNVLDVVAEVNAAFKSEPPPVPCWDR